jgi:hypothetical protein
MRRSMKKGKITRVKWPKGLDTSGWEHMRTHMIEGVGNPDVVRIGASDISVLTGSNKWKCAQRLFHHLTGYHHSFLLTETTLAGHLAEPTVMKRWEGYVHGDEYQSLLNVRDGVRVRKTRKADFFLLNSKYPNLFASLDYIPSGVQHSPWTGEKYKPLTPNEIKTTSEHYYRLWPDGIAQQYREQLHVQMMLGGTEVGLLHVYLDGRKYIVREVEYDPELGEYIQHVSGEFANVVTAGKVCVAGMREAERLGDTGMSEDFQAMYDTITPDPIGMGGDGKDGDNVLLAKELFEDSNDIIRQGDEDDLWNMNQYLKCNSIIKKVNIYKDELKARLLLSCGEFEGIEINDRKLINRRAKEGKKAYFSIR